MDIRVSKVSNPDGSTELFFEQLGHWDYYQPILQILVQENGCSVVDEKDKVTDYDTLLRLGSFSFYFKHDYMLGNYLYASSKMDVPALEQLAWNVINSIRLKLKSLHS